LNEGWDVLNLFDIVRLYDTKVNRGAKPGQTTMSEAQLIGRGARYCPFQITAEQPYDGRKFDDDLNNELRICEELYYHSAYNPRYIRELNTALEEIGIKAKDTEKRSSVRKAQPDSSSGQRDLLPFLKTMQDRQFAINLKTDQAKSRELFNSINSETTRRKEQEYRLAEFGDIIIRKAMSKLPFYYYSNLKTIFPQLNSVSEFISSADYLGLIRLKVTGLPNQLTSLTPEEKIGTSIKTLQDISTALSANKTTTDSITIQNFN
jgi:type III restriction enzyme